MAAEDRQGARAQPADGAETGPGGPVAHLIGAPTDAEIFDLIQKNWPAIPKPAVRNISVLACECVGCALQEADAQLEMAA